MSTLRRRIDDPAELENPNVTKVVVDRDGYALYFSRAPIPFVRADGDAGAARGATSGSTSIRRDCLLTLAGLPPTPLEQSEALEQLRALEHGIRIKALETRYDSIGVDTPDDLERVRTGCDDRRRAGGAGHDTRRAQMHMGDINVKPEARPRRPVKYILVTGGVVSSLGKGLAAASIGALLEGHGYKVALQKFDPYINVDPGHDEPVPARRGLRHRRRRRDRPRSGPLRAVHQPDDDAEQQLDDRQDLPVGHPEGAPRRLPRPDRPGHSAHHQRDQGQHPRRRHRATSTSCSSRSAARSATSRASRSSRPSASSGRTSAARTRSTST